MIYRIQTVYFLIAMLLFAVILGGTDFLTFQHVALKDYDSIDVFGLSSYTYTNGKHLLAYTNSIPVFVLVIGMILLLFASMMGYKNLKRQLAISRFTFFINALLLLIFVAWITYLYSGPSEHQFNMSLGVGFYLAVCTLPITYFAYKSVLRDKALLDSIDRIR